MKITIHEIQKIVSRFKGRSGRIDLKAGGFEVHLLETFSHGNTESFILRLFGYLVSCPASIFRMVPFTMRREKIAVLAKKAGPVFDRYPSFLYNLYGADKVQYKIPC